MSEMMLFPDTWEEYERFYGFRDDKEIYTNGSRLIPYIHWCARTHDRAHIVDMVNYLGYSKE